MAKMGKRITARDKKQAEQPAEPAFCLIVPTGTNLIVSPSRIDPISIAANAPSSLGLPIMREGFITGTGFLPTR